MANDSKLRYFLGNDRFPYFISGVFVILSLLLFYGWFWCWLFPNSSLCEPCEEPPPCEFDCEEDCPQSGSNCPDWEAQIFLPDAHTGVYIATDNNFIVSDNMIGPLLTDYVPPDTDPEPLVTCEERQPLDCDPDDEDLPCGRTCSWPPRLGAYTAGVLFQMGLANGENYYDGAYIDHIDPQTNVKVTLDLAEGDFDWIDVNPNDFSCAIDPYHAYGLFYGNNSDGDRITSVGCDNETSSNPECLRGRGIHADLTPSVLMTYWTGHLYYGVFPEKAEGGTDIEGVDMKTRFDLYDPVNADVWKNGCLIYALREVTRIQIKYRNPGEEHGALDMPPMDGGGVLTP